MNAKTPALRVTAKARQAFSIVEAMVAMGVIGITFVSLYAGFSSGFATIQIARENLRATQIMLEKVETIRLYTWDQINTSGFIPATFTAPYYPAATNQGGLTYSGRVTVSAGPTDTTYGTEIRRFDIQITWTSGGINRSRSVSTYVTRNGLQNYIY